MQKIQTRLVFSHNLASLMSDQISISELSRELPINRTQLHRFLNGESFPRPDMLEKICEYFDTDARILTVPLADINASQQHIQSNILPELKDCFRPAPRSMLPDGQYDEWRKIPDSDGQYMRQLVHIRTEGSIRCSRAIMRCCTDPVTSTRKRQTYVGQAIMQAGGFAILDRTPNSFGVRYRRFKFGYELDERYFPGWEASANSNQSNASRPITMLLLRKIELGRPELRKIAAAGPFLNAQDVPVPVQYILNALHDA